MARSSYSGYALTIAGIQYIFTTRDLGTLTSSSALWWGAETGATYANGFLCDPRSQWTERAKPLDGDLDVGSVPFTLHDARLSGATQGLLAQLATRRATQVTSSPLASSVTVAATSWTVGDGTVFTNNTFAWCNREVVRITGISSNTLTVTRGRLGTKARAQTVDPDASRAPEVYTACPWTARRKVVLWGVTAAGVASVLWVGFATRAPALSSDGARFDLSVEPLWNVLRACPVGEVVSGARLVGFSRSGVSTDSTANPRLLSTTVQAGSNLPATVATNGAYRDWESMIRAHAAVVSANTTTRGTRVDVAYQRSGANAEVSADSTAVFNVRVSFLGEYTATAIASQRVASPARYSANLTLEKVPNSAAVVVNYQNTTFPLSSLRSLPASWAADTWTDDALTTVQVPGLRTHIDKEWSALLTGVSVAGDGAIGPRATGTVEVLPREYTGATPPAVFILRDPPPFQTTYRVRTEHWLYGVKNSLVNLCTDGDSNDWDWTDVDTDARTLNGLNPARDWLFDGRRTFGSVVMEACQLFGCSPVTRGGRLSIVPWRWPDASAASAATFTRNDLIGKPTWSRWPEGLANRIKVTSSELTIDATVADSIDRYGPGRQLQTELAGAEDQRSVTGDPIEFAREVIGRLSLWSDPLDVVTFTVTLESLASVELGDQVTLSEWMLPSGDGGRGLSTAKALVTARTIDLGASTLTLEAILFDRVSYPYAPCLRVASLVSSDKIEYEAAGYVNGASSYSGGNDGVDFAVGDKVQFVVRNSTTLTVDDRTILSLDTTMRTVTLTSALSAGMQSAITGGSMVDMRFSEYATCVATQQDAWMYVADDATRVIDGTAEAARVIAP